MRRHRGLQRQIRGKKALAATAVQLVGVPAVSFTPELLRWPAASISARPAHCSQLPLPPTPPSAEGVLVYERGSAGAGGAGSPTRRTDGS